MTVPPELAMRAWFEDLWNKGDEATIDRMLHADGVVCRVTATHRGGELGFAATDRHVEFWGFSLGRFDQGKLVEGWNCFDFLGMYQQLGVPLNLPQ